jgi:hypothetical protein
MRFAGFCLVIAATLLTGGCAAPVQMYHWPDYQRNVYDYMKGEAANPAEQLQRMSKQVDAASVAGRPLPPGFRAHVAMLQIQLGQYAEAKQQFEAEKTAFPESAKYMDFLLKQMSEKKS